MSSYDEEDYLILSEIQRYAFCPREWALTHIEQHWIDNVNTIDGNILHERVHNDWLTEKRSDVIITRGMKVVSHTLGITGVCDAVEFHASPDGISLSGRGGKWLPVPVEYKRGKPKEHDADLLQLCAQALCLEQMLVCTIPKGFLYYHQTRRRMEVEFTPQLRSRVSELFGQMRQLKQRGHTPRVKPRAACKNCALFEVCVPQICKQTSIADYVRTLLQEVQP